MNLWTESLWGDEGFSALAVMKPFGEMMGVVMRDTAPPGFYGLGWLWVRLAGATEVGLRTLPLILIVMTAIFGGLIVHKLQKDKRMAVLAGLLVLGNPFLNQYAFEWRMYALLVCTIVGSTYFWITKKWGGYVIMTLAALYTHHFALFTVVGQAAVFMICDFAWKKPKTYMRQLAPYLAVAAGYIPWLYPMYLQTVRVRGAGFWLAAPKIAEAADTIFKFVVPGGLRGMGIAVALGAAGLILVKEWRAVGKDWVKLLAVFGAPVVLAFGISYLVTPIFYDRYLLSVAAGAAILLALGTKRGAAGALAAMVVIYGWMSYRQFMGPKKKPFRELAEYVKAEKRNGDSLINYNGRAHHLWESKYYGIGAPIYVPGEPLPLYVGTAQMTTGDTVKELPRVTGRLGVIASEPVETLTLPGYRILEKKEFAGLTFSWWKVQ